jgi:hypothetical protein
MPLAQHGCLKENQRPLRSQGRALNFCWREADAIALMQDLIGAGRLAVDAD